MKNIMLTEKEINRFAGQKLRTLRLTLGISCATVGKEIGISGQQVQKYESGKNRLSADKVYRLAELFEVSAAVFFPAKDASHAHEAIPPASMTLIRMMNRISEEYHEPLYAILRALVLIIQKSDAPEQQP